MTYQQVQLMLLYLLGFKTDEYMTVLYDDDTPLLINEKCVYVEDGVSIIPHLNRYRLNIIYDKYSILSIFEYAIFYNKRGIKLHYYYTEFDNGKLSISVKSDSTIIKSDYFNNHCLSYIDIILRIYNVQIDLKQFER